VEGYNKLLERQLKRYLKGARIDSPEWQQLLSAISQAYDHHDEDRILIERSLELSSHELTEANRSLLEANKIIALKNKDLIDSLEYARLVQDSLLTRENYIREVFPESFIFNQPKNIVSGDFYWLFHSDDHIYLASADCTGHGVPGAFMSVISYRFLNQAVRDQGLEKPSEILAYLNEEINYTFRTRTTDPGAKNALDIALVRMHKKKNRMEFSGVGQKMVVARNGELIEIKGENTHIGQNLDTQITPIPNQELELLPGSALYMFSDGFADQFGGPGMKRYGNDRFLKLLDSVQNLDFDDQKKQLQAAFEDWKNGYEQVDDTLIMGVKV
jgi:serine phosphatase RsbU (regulator of sigma subunit)